MQWQDRKNVFLGFYPYYNGKEVAAQDRELIEQDNRREEKKESRAQWIYKKVQIGILDGFDQLRNWQA